MSLDREEVRRLARLARLEVTGEEIDKFAGQLHEILQYVAKIREAPVEGVEPTIHVLPLTNVFREDEVRPSLDREEALANAPQREEGFFRVPKILEEN